ncbi:MAG: hypothetical protein HGB10_04930 [Coriobacteriia bacterium]|nr:hypothetical protein [Coriobacteriia bacterium]
MHDPAFDEQPATPAPERALNVLFVGAYDSTNYAYVELVHELERRGHTCTVVVENERDSVNNKMFINDEIPMVPVRNYPVSDLDAVDFVFTGPFVQRGSKALYGAIRDKQKFLISFATLFSSVTMRNPPDLVLASSERKFREFEDNGLRYNMVAVGNPQYDPLIRLRESREPVPLDQIRKVLIVDQGAYPLGEAGKDQLGETLMAIARNNPEMTFHIKPRYLPSEEGVHLHSISDHLYAHLPDKPDNLILIHEPTILEELILEFDAMITTWSTAHLDAAALGLPLLLIDGLDSVDVFDVRKQRVAAAYEHLAETGCLHDRRDLMEGPAPFSYVAEAYVQAEFHDSDTPAAPRVADLLERIEEVVLRQGHLFATGFELTFEQFMSDVESLDTLPAGSTQVRLNRRLFRGLNSVAQSAVYDNRCLGYVLDMSQVLPVWDLRMNPEDTDDDVNTHVRELRALIREMKTDYFENHPEGVASDPLVQDYYFDYLFKGRRYDELMGYAGPVVVPASLEYNIGRMYLKKRRPFSAAKHFVESFSISLQEPCRILRKDRNIKVTLSNADTIWLPNAILFFLNLYGKDQALSVVDVEGRPDFEVLVYYKMRALIRLGQIDDARALCEEYAAVQRDVPAAPRRGGWKRRSLRWFIGLYRGRLARAAKRLGVADAQ